MPRNTAGFVLSPPVWAGENPRLKFQDLPALGSFGHQEVFRKTLKAGLDVQVSLDGFFSFDFSKFAPNPPEDEETIDNLVDIMRDRIRAFNCYLVCLYTAVLRIENRAIEKMVVTPRLVLLRENLDEIGMGGDPSAFAQLAHRFPGTRGTSSSGLLDRSPTLGHDILEMSFDIYDQLLLRAEPDLLVQTELLLRSTAALENHDFPLALITSWAVCEYLAHRLWDRYIQDNRKRGGSSFLSGDRIRRLKDTRTYTAAVILEVLSLQGRISKKLYARLTATRSARNGWLHELKPISRRAGEEAQEAAQQMLNLVENLDWQLPPTIGIHS